MGKFADELAPKFADAPVYGKNTLADLCERFIDAMERRGRQLSADQLSRLGVIQRSDLGQKEATKLVLADYTTFADERKQNKVLTLLHRNKRTPLKELKPPTILHDFTNIGNVLTWAFDYENLKVDLELFKKAKRILKSEGVIGKAEPRSRRPQVEELLRRREHFIKHGQLYMVVMDEWQVASSRRVGESCALLWTDWDIEGHTILVRKMKDPKKKNKQKIVALTPEATEMLYRLAYQMDERPELRTDEPRIFPFNKRTVSTASTEANKALGIPNLRLHDSRRDCISRLLERGHTSKQVTLVSGHETTHQVDRTYGKPDPSLFAKQMAERAVTL